MLEGLTTGRNVHFIDDDGAHLAAIVTSTQPPNAVPNGVVNLCVFDPFGHPMPRVAIPCDPQAEKKGTWHFIERVG